jgi:hypothetical protein
VFRAGDHHSPADWRRIRAELERRGKAMWLFGDDLADEDVWDGVCLYAYLGLSDERDEDACLAEAVARTTSRAHELGRSLIAPVMPGFDARSYVHPDAWSYVVPRRNGEHYEKSWRAWAASGADWIAVNSWNEWYERSNIEPDREWGDAFLRLTRPHAEAFKRRR